MIIYKATNCSNGKIYVGQTVGKLSIRKNVHRYQVNKGSINYFTKALRKYGIDNFHWEIIDIASTIKELNEKEIYWIKTLNSNTLSIGYNISSGGKNGRLNKIGVERIRKMRKGYKVSVISRQRMSESAKKRGNCITPTGSKKISDAHKGNKYASNLNKRDIHEIFKLWSNDLTQQLIANQFGVTQSSINNILQGRNWREIYDMYSNKIKRKTRLSKSEMKEIKKLKNTKSFQKLAILFSVSKSTISNVMNNVSEFYNVDS